MNVLPEQLEFEWDKGNITKNFEKHGVANQESEQAFVNQPIVLLEDEKHSQTEKRRLLLGKTDHGRPLGIIFTTRKNKIRIISSRPMNKKERRLYEAETDKT